MKIIICDRCGNKVEPSWWDGLENTRKTIMFNDYELCRGCYNSFKRFMKQGGY